MGSFPDLPANQEGKKVYIPMARYTQLINSRGVQKMAQDLMKTIGALQDAAVGRCRKRVEDAALKAKGLFRGGEQEGDGPDSCKKLSCGVTSILKRKHGL